MSISRWDPWADMVSLRDAVDRLVSESFIRPITEGGRSSANALAVDVREQGDNFVISAPMPGVSPDNVEISVLGDTIRIRGERREERQEGGDGQRWLMREQRYGQFERAVRLPAPVKADAAQAQFQNGILTLMLPKSEEAKERKIPIQSVQRSGQGQDVQISASSGSASGQQAQQMQQAQPPQQDQQAQQSS